MALVKAKDLRHYISWVVSTAGFGVALLLRFLMFLVQNCWVLCNSGLRNRYAERRPHDASYLALTRHSSAPFPASSSDKCQKQASGVMSPSVLVWLRLCVTSAIDPLMHPLQCQS
jgi:hypothetical protein